MKQEEWNWYAFAVISIAIVAKNLGTGIFQQAEEALFLSELGQTTGVQIGWPFVVLVTEAYTLNFYWSFGVSRVIAHIAGDVLVAILLILAGTSLMSHCMHCSRWRVNLLGVLSATGLFATLTWEATEWYSYQQGVGALSNAFFRCVEAIVLFSIAASWYGSLKLVGCFTDRETDSPPRHSAWPSDDAG